VELRRQSSGPLLLAGLSFYGDPFRLAADWSEDNEIGRLWKRFVALLAIYPEWAAEAALEPVTYELHLETDQTAATGEREVFVGVPVAGPEGLPVALCLKWLPPAEYAVFTLSGAEITADWAQTVFGQALPEAGLIPAAAYSLQRYDERFKGMDRLEESQLEVWAPVSESGA
jgi:predicted transcriptional regulator YdeE